MRVKRAIFVIGVGLLICGATAGFAETGDLDFFSTGSRQHTLLTEPCQADEWGSIDLAWAGRFDQQPGTRIGIKCQVESRNDGKSVRGVSVTLGGALATGDAVEYATLANRSKSTNKAGQKTFNFPYTPPPTDDEVIVIIQGTVAGDQVFDELDISCGIIQGRGCEMSNHEACLGVGGRNRWELSVSSSLGQGRVVKNTKNEARFSFFDPTLADLLVRILNECSNNDHFWVFYEAQTNVEFDLVVTDTSTGESRQYNNEGQGPFRPILDTSAFATCP